MNNTKTIYLRQKDKENLLKLIEVIKNNPTSFVDELIYPIALNPIKEVIDLNQITLMHIMRVINMMYMRLSNCSPEVEEEIKEIYENFFKGIGEIEFMFKQEGEND